MESPNTEVSIQISETPDETNTKSKSKSGIGGVSWSNRLKHTATNTIVPNVILGGIGFWKPAWRDAVMKFLPAELQVTLPTINAVIGFFLMPHVEQGITKLVELIKECKNHCQENPNESPAKYQKLATEISAQTGLNAEDYGHAGTAITATLVYTFLSTIENYYPEVAKAVLPQLPPVATPLFVAFLGYKLGELVYQAIPQNQQTLQDDVETNNYRSM